LLNTFRNSLYTVKNLTLYRNYKIDVQPRHVSSSEGANQKGLAYAEVSAKTGVNELFVWLIDELHKKPIVRTKNTVQLNKDTIRETCCLY
jgi:hypothetical protein